MKLVDDAGNLWRRWSVRIQAAMLVLGGSYWAFLPQEWKDAIPKSLLAAVVVIGAAATLTAQAVKQDNLDKKKGGDQ